MDLRWYRCLQVFVWRLGAVLKQLVCVLKVNIQSYTGLVQAFVFRMNTEFDLILGQDWCKANGVDILYTQSCLMMSHCTTDGSSHKLICDAAEFDSCSIVSAAELKDHLQEGDEAFKGVKKALTSAPVLALPDLNSRFEVICDACGVDLGAVLVQGGRPIAFEGKRMTQAEQKYGTSEKELLAVVHALELWRCYLDGVEFTVVTDHSSNTFFHTHAVLSPRQARWAERLSRFSFQWEYRAGRNNVADPLSRHPLILANIVLCGLSIEAGTDDSTDDSSTDDGIADATDVVADILAVYANDAWSADDANIAKEGLHLQHGAYWKGKAIAVPDVASAKAAILKELHGSNYAGHVGIHRTVYNVKRIHWWPDMAKDIREFVKACDTCQHNKGLQRAPAGKLMP